MSSRNFAEQLANPDESSLSAGPDDLSDDETAITELTFLPDGRICLFGASREVLELLGMLQLGDTSLDARLAALRTQPTNPSVNSEHHD
ncbi:MAG TPA: hypothetical protein PLY87_24735 [Planctomycetaceae bacterium]|nr:hypothetical protein [Planctomycetaceae bacterium]HQZ68327.1 hypothetical protein [Planctomycetaceae bacterium]HRA88199.1 hypothetical protein [Planctomycetaceae bacterium]